MSPSAVHSPSPIWTPPCFTSGCRLRNPRLRLHLHHGHQLSATAIRSSTSTKGEGDGTTNEEGVLTTLGMRGIKEMRAMEIGGEQEWDKELSYTFYESEVCELMGLMHLCLSTRTRPRLAIGIMVTLHPPTSVLVVAMRVLDVAKGILEELNI